MSAGVSPAPRFERGRCEPGMCLGRAGTLARITGNAMDGLTSTSVMKALGAVAHSTQLALPIPLLGALASVGGRVNAKIPMVPSPPAAPTCRRAPTSLDALGSERDDRFRASGTLWE